MSVDEFCLLRVRYAAHNADRYGLSYCEGERGMWLASRVGRGKGVLDVGCRDGTLTRWFRDDNHITGMDVDGEALRRGQRIGHFDCIHCWDACLPWPFTANVFNIVVMAETLEHLRNPIAALQQAWRVLKTGGMLLGSVPNDRHWRVLLGLRAIDSTHRWLFTPETLQRVLSDWFSHIEVVPYGGRLDHRLLVAGWMFQGQ